MFIRLTKLQLKAMNGTVTQYHRPFTSNVITTDMLTTLRDVTKNGTDFSKKALARATDRLFDISPLPYDEIEIPHGWGAMRFSFMAEFTFSGSSGVQRKVLTGYTDRLGADLKTKAVDPELRFYPNNCITYLDNGEGPFVDYFIAGTSQSEYSTLITPTSVFNVLEMRDLCPNLTNTANSIDTRNSLRIGARLTDRENSSYMAMVSKVLTALDERKYDGEDSTGDILRGKAKVRDASLLKQSVTAELCGMFGLDETGYFTMEQLSELVGDVDELVEVVIPSEFDASGSTAGERSRSWNDTTPESRLAVELGNILPTLAIESGVTTATFFFTNREGEDVLDISSLTLEQPSSDHQEKLKEFHGRLLDELIPDLMRDGQAVLRMHVFVDVLGMSYFRFTLNDGEEVIYEHPTYADALLVPMRGVSNAALEGIVDDLVRVHLDIKDPS